MTWVSLCALDELTEGCGKYVEIDGFHLAVFLSGGEVFVLDDICPHAGASLSGGFVENGCAVCPRHAWSFQLADGCMRDLPGVGIRTYPTRRFTRAGQADLIQAELPIY